MLKIVSAENKNNLNIKIKGDIDNSFELIAVLDVIIRELKEQYNLSIREILTKLIDFKYDSYCKVKKEN